jgi:hypothetical protein
MHKNALFLTVAAALLSAGLALTGVQSRYLGYACLTLFFLMAVSAVLQWLQLPDVYRRTAAALGSLNFGSRIPLREAASIAYTEARFSGSVYADAAERMGTDKSPDGILDWIAHLIAKDADVWGKRPPSTKTEVISPKESNNGTFSDGATTLRLRDEGRSVFTDLQVARKDLRNVVRKVREGLKVDTPI